MVQRGGQLVSEERAMKLSHIAVLLVVLLASSVSPTMGQFENVVIKTVPVSGNIHMLTGAGGNIGVSVGNDGILIVDDQFAPLADKIRAALADLSAGELEFVLNTHWHGDHTGGNEVFGETSHIIAHTNVRERLSTPQNLRGSTIDPKPEVALPVITFDESLSLHFNGEEVRVVHFPHGHTDGDSVVFFTTSNVAHMGDDFWPGRFPFVDLEAGGDVEGLAKNIAAVIGWLPADIKIIPGHGTLSGLDDLKSFHGMLAETTAIVRDGVAAGNTLDQIKETGLPEKWREWGTGFIKTGAWIETIHTSLTAK
jgi:glyoxylase-like metal-dependent hydrolase (beta-lactamase superfamily II)